MGRLRREDVVCETRAMQGADVIENTTNLAVLQRPACELLYTVRNTQFGVGT
jgi:hypothetical protein